MADSASDPKVEDVLSSVRRLVSGEIPRKRREPATGPGALVLTNDHRIKSDPLTRVAARSLEQRIAELEAAVDSGSEEFEPDGSEDQSQHRPDRIVYTRPPKSEEEAHMRRTTVRLSEITLIETGPANEDETGDMAQAQFRHGASSQRITQTPDSAEISEPDATPDEEEEDDATAMSFDAPASEQGSDHDAADAIDEAPMAVDVPTAAPRRADVRFFSSPDDVVARLEARLDRGDTEPVEPIGFGADMGDINVVAGDNFLRADPDDANDFDTALAEAVEASVGAANTFHDEDTLSADTGAAESTQVADAVEEPAEAEADPAPAEPEQAEPEPAAEAPAPELAAEAAVPDRPLEEEAPDTSETSPEQAAAALDQLSDEDAMRLLVARLIREELQGTLGERITQNVRKLVRREIKRALDARDLV